MQARRVRFRGLGVLWDDGGGCDDGGVDGTERNDAMRMLTTVKAVWEFTYILHTFPSMISCNAWPNAAAI